ncbi:hypothetical protein N665_0483s0011 [Sinapis alba]|nr:hypothetical protein N665_0483s0011 [Sinapis alba]
MESLILKNGKPGTPVKDRSKSSENANPNVSHAKSPLTKSSASPLVKSANPKRSAQKNQSPNPNPKPSQAVFSPRNRIRERRFVVVAKKNSRKGEKKDQTSPAEEIECRCGERKKGNMKCVCVAYETLRASQEEFLKKRSESEEVKEECCNLEDELEGEESMEPEVIGALKRTRGKVVEESRRSVPESGKVMNLVEAFEKLTCFRTNKDEGDQTFGDMERTVKLELCGRRQESKFSEGEKETHHHHHQHTWSSSFCPNELVLTAKNLGLDPNASVSSSWDSSHGSVLSGMSNAGRRSRRNSLDSSTTMGSRKSKKKQVKVTSLKPFKLRTEQRGKVKEEEFAKKLQEITMVEEKMRIPIAQGLPWTTDEPECLVKPHVKDITIPVDLTLHSDVRAVERAEFDQQVAEKMSFIEQYKMDREREQKVAEEEEIRRLRKELVPKAQPMPYFDRPFIPRRSNKHPTAPRDPKFHRPQHKKIRCCSSLSSWSETGSCIGSDVGFT